MKVLVVCSGNAIHGISPVVKAQVDSLKDLGVNTEIFSIDKPGLSGYFLAIPRLRKKVYEFKPDIIHAHYGLSGIVTFLSFSGCKIIISFMGDDLIGSLGSRKKYTLISKMLVFVNKNLARFFYDFSITKSEELNMIISKTKNKVVLPNGVNLDMFYPEDMSICRKKLGLKEEENIILFPSDPSRAEKNYSLAQEAMFKLNNDKIKLQTVYSEKQSMLFYYYNAADVLLLTSIHEGSPNVIKEAMACGCPIVTTNVGDVSEILENTTGHYLSDFSPQSVAQNLIKAMEFRRSFGITNGKDKLVHLNLDSGSVARKLVYIYNNVINVNKQIN